MSDNLPPGVTQADVDRAMGGGEETCFNCRFRLGPIIFMCGCKDSEFYEGPIMADGYCPQFRRPE
jgi:hypothetical protein